MQREYRDLRQTRKKTAAVVMEVTRSVGKGALVDVNQAENLPAKGVNEALIFRLVGEVLMDVEQHFIWILF